MEVWIRSQDKEKLCKVHDLCIRENQNENNETNYVIQDVYTMGTYKTKERALEVLDEIEERICLLNTISLVHDYNSLISFKNAIGEDKTKGLCFSYQMPKE